MLRNVSLCPLFVCAVLSLPAIRATAQNPVPESTINAPAKLRFTENYQYGTATVYSGNVTETQSQWRGKLTADVEVDTKNVKLGNLPASTPFYIKIGKSEFKTTLDTDPEYHPGQTQASLKKKQPTASGGSQITQIEVRLRWDKNKVQVHLEANISAGATAAVAPDFVNTEAGEVKAETKATLEFAGMKSDFVVPFKGKVSRKSVNRGDASGELVTLSLRGDAKTETASLKRP